MKELKGHFEARLAAYNRVGSGDKLTLLLHPQELPTELLGLPLGARLTIAWVALGDDEKPALAQPVAKAKAPKERRRFHDLSFREQAVLRCKDERFMGWLIGLLIGRDVTSPTPIDTSLTEEHAAAIIRAHCGVQSRKELDTNEDAAAKWKILNDAFELETQGYAEMVR